MILFVQGGFVMQLRRLFGSVIIAGILLFSFMPVHAGNPVPDSVCHMECEKVYEQEAGVCGRIAVEAESKRCGDESNAHYRKCCSECDEILTKCKDKCYEEYNDKMKECNKIPDKATRTKCRQAASEQLGECIRKCGRRKRSGD
jgi:hypothetical protein